MMLIAKFLHHSKTYAILCLFRCATCFASHLTHPQPVVTLAVFLAVVVVGVALIPWLAVSLM